MRRHIRAFALRVAPLVRRGESARQWEIHRSTVLLVALLAGHPTFAATTADAASSVNANDAPSDAPTLDNERFDAYATSSGNLTGVWAEQNTRDAIYAALRRKETFATSGTRLQFRFRYTPKGQIRS